MRARRLNANVVSVVGEAPPSRQPGDIEHEAMVYRPSTDELTIQIGPENWMRLAPGKRFASMLAQLMTEVDASEQQRATLPVDARCERCGTPVRTVGVGAELVQLDRAADPNGIYVLIGDERARLLRPMEEPTVPTYSIHRCS